ncbi:hypothetical protein [Streptomyces sp. NPDC048825]|uniref:hypothetical protein n=1 Tax=Streptomyces sp. NPDC048825 TaxID=3365592 RepID=UPI00371B5976
MRDRLNLNDLLRQHRVDLAGLDPAPAEPSLQDRLDRVCGTTPPPCTLCGVVSPTCRIIATPHGPRWVDLCAEHGLATWPRA